MHPKPNSAPAGSLLEATARTSVKQNLPREGAGVLPLRQIESA